jgi:hypothetical protein
VYGGGAAMALVLLRSPSIIRERRRDPAAAPELVRVRRPWR